MKNTLDWGKIKNGFSGFEKLALLYVKETFENSSWTATPATRDGNKDAVAIILGYQAGILEDQKWWMEAKYSNETVSLTRYRLDATIVSAILEKNVAKIIFITNLLLKPKTIADLQNALKLATGYDDIRFVCKYDLEYWLFRKRQYMQDFFEPENCIFDLPELFIVNKAEYYYSSTDILAFKESLQFLQKDIPYRMYFSVYSSVKKNCKIISNSTFSGIKILSDRNIHLYPGENRITVDFKLSGKFPGKRKKIYNSDPLFNIEGQPVISEKFITVSENAGEYVVLEYQERILKDLEKFLKKFHEENIFKIYEIIGNSGSGKSFIANNFLQLKDCRKTGVYYFEFSNSSADNMIALVNLIIYIHFPYLAADDVDIDYINTLNHENYISVCLKKLIENRSDFEELNKTISDIHNADEIFPANFHINPRIIILDNVQKLKDMEKYLLTETIQGLYIRKAPIFFLVIEQESLQDMFYNKLSEKVPVKRLNCGLESDDILKHLKKLPFFRIENDNLMNYQILFPNIVDLIMYLKYLRDIKEEISNMDDLYLSYHAFINSDIADIYMQDQFNKLFSENEDIRKYCDIIFWSDHGLSQEELNQNIIKVIEKLLSQNLIKYNANGNIVPCHDIYKIFYQEHFKPLQSDFLLSDRGLTEITSMISSGLFSITQIYDYSKELRKLIIDQKFYTVKYILENLFQNQNRNFIQNCIGIELYYELYILYAIANTNISRKTSGKNLFEKICNETANNYNIRIMKVHEEATWELINSFYDSLMFQDADKKIKELFLTLCKMKKLGALHGKLAVNIRYHDVIVIKSLIEADMGSPLHYVHFVKRQESMTKNNFAYRAVTFSVRYAQTIMRCMPEKAIQLFENAVKEIEGTRGNSDKYYLWSTFDYYYMLITFQNDFTVFHKLTDVHEELKANYYNDYRKRIAGVAALFFQTGDMEQGFQYIFSDACVKREMRPRQKAFYYETMALYEALHKNYSNASDFLSKAADIFENLPEYKDIVLHNIDILQKESFSQNSVKYCFEKSLDEKIYYLDPRCIW